MTMQPRHSDGKFGEKTGAAPEIVVTSGPSDKVMEDAAYSIIYGSKLPEGYRIVATEEYSGDEHDTSRTVVLEDEDSGRFYRYGFRYNYAMSDVELVDYLKVEEVFPRSVPSVEYFPEPLETQEEVAASPFGSSIADGDDVRQNIHDILDDGELWNTGVGDVPLFQPDIAADRIVHYIEERDSVESRSSFPPGALESVTVSETDSGREVVAAARVDMDRLFVSGTDAAFSAPSKSNSDFVAVNEFLAHEYGVHEVREVYDSSQDVVWSGSSLAENRDRILSFDRDRLDGNLDSKFAAWLKGRR